MRDQILKGALYGLLVIVIYFMTVNSCGHIKGCLSCTLGEKSFSSGDKGYPFPKQQILDS